ncbi:EpsG family protein [Aerococcus urinaeequi]
MTIIFLGTFLLYFLLAALTGFLAWLAQISHNRLTQEIIILLATIPASIIAGIRYEVGTDYSGYLGLFNGLLIRDDLEIGFEKLLIIIKSFTSNVQILFFIMAFIIVFFTLRGLLAYKEKINIGLAMFIFMLTFYLTGLNISRQMIAASIGFYAIQYLFKKKPITYFIYIILALTFHLSMIVLIPLYFIYNNHFIKANKKSIIVLSIIALLILFNLDQISLFIASYIPQFQSRLGYFVKKPYVDFSFLGFIKDILYIIPSIFVYLKGTNDEKFNYFLLFFIISIIFGIAGDIYINNAITRITIPLEMSLLYLIPYSSKKLLNNHNYALLSLNFLSVLVIFYWNFFISGFGEIVPFRTIF